MVSVRDVLDLNDIALSDFSMESANIETNEENGILQTDQKRKKIPPPTEKQIGKKDKISDEKPIDIHLGTTVLNFTDAKAALSQIKQLKADQKYSATLGFLSDLFRKLHTLDDGQFSKIEIDITVRQYQDYKEHKESFQYKLTAKPIGYCLLITNSEFYQVPGCPKSKKLPARPGAEYDARRIEGLMSTIGFKIFRKENLKKWEIEHELKTMAKADHKKLGCFLCIISSHGTASKVYGSDGYDVILGPQIKMFKADSCPDLVGKPKIFLVQACIIENEGDKAQETQQPMINDVDFLYGYSTLPGYLAYNAKGDQMGSFYLNLLCQHLQDKYKTCNLVAILEEINREMAEKKSELRPNDKASVTTFVDCLRGHLCFQ